MESIFQSIVAAIEQKQPFALAIISGVKGSSPQKKGAKALFFADGRIHGTLGGGCLEAEVRERARLALLKQQPATFDLVLDHDFGWDDGLICGGKVFGLILPQAAQAEGIWRELARREKTLTWSVDQEFAIDWATDSFKWLYRESVSPPCVLWIAGSGHVAQSVAPLAGGRGHSGRQRARNCSERNGPTDSATRSHCGPENVAQISAVSPKSVPQNAAVFSLSWGRGPGSGQTLCSSSRLNLCAMSSRPTETASSRERAPCSSYRWPRADGKIPHLRSSLRP